MSSLFKSRLDVHSETDRLSASPRPDPAPEACHPPFAIPQDDSPGELSLNVDDCLLPAEPPFRVIGVGNVLF
jgi:hypothetical protein